MSAPASPPGPPIRVLAAVLRRDDRWLVGLRPPGKRHAGLWEFPGGKVRPGESDLDAMVRELEEELEIAVTGLGAEVFDARDPGSRYHIVFVETHAAGDPRPVEHDALRWASVEELLEIPLAPSDARFVREVLSR